jgi:hypothetical protein
MANLGYPFSFRIGDQVTVTSDSLHKDKQGTIKALELSAHRTVASVRLVDPSGYISVLFTESELRKTA